MLLMLSQHIWELDGMGKEREEGIQNIFSCFSEIPPNVWKRADDRDIVTERAALQAVVFMIPQRKGSYADCSCSGKMLEG